MEITDEQAKDLAVFGEVELGNNYKLRFTEQQDSDTSINDYDYLGTVKHIWRGQEQEPRPEGFDGLAEKISTRRETYWWQPPTDLRHGWHNYEHKEHLRKEVRDILEFGFFTYTIELCYATDAYGNDVVVDYACIGGMHPFMDDDDKTEYIKDLAHEIKIKSLVA